MLPEGHIRDTAGEGASLSAIGYRLLRSTVQRYLISVSQTVCFTRHADHREQPDSRPVDLQPREAAGE